MHMIARSCGPYDHVVRAVIGEDVRVVEETGLREEIRDPVETVRNIVRETRVDVERVTVQLIAATLYVTNPNAGKSAFRRMTAGLDVRGAPPAAEPATFGEAGKIADIHRNFDITTDAVLRAAREGVRDVRG